jgi:hypothetical protein
MDDTTSNLIPINMQEVQLKLKWNLAHNYSSLTENGVILDAILENVRTMIIDALEGPYWGAEWENDYKSIIIKDITDKEIAHIYPSSTSFIEDFKINSPKLIRELNIKVQKIVEKN